MPYIIVKIIRKDENIRQKLAERINETVLDVLGCAPESLNLAIEETERPDWQTRILDGEVADNAEHLYIRAGKKLYAAEHLTAFYLSGCPYCRHARQALEELIAEDPAYGRVAVDWIEETERPDVAGRYDYYRVPSYFRGQEKLHETSPAEDYGAIKANLKAALDALLPR